MKTISALSFIFALVSVSAQASGLNLAPVGPTQADVVAAKAQVEAALASVPGVTLVGDSLCDVRTGVSLAKIPSDQLDNFVLVNCLVVGVADDDSEDAVHAVYPVGSKFNGIYVDVLETGYFHAE